MVKKLLREGETVATYGDQERPWSARFSTNPNDPFSYETLHTAGYVVLDLGLDKVLDPPKQVS